MRDRGAVFCDTNFFIHLLNAESPLCGNAHDYYRHFLQNGYELYVSAIAVAEFCVKGTLDELPLRNVRIAPFDAAHAVYAGACAKALFKARAAGAIETGRRAVILNDAKMMAQAQCNGACRYITADTDSKRIYDVLKREGKVSFGFVDLNIPFADIP